MFIIVVVEFDRPDEGHHVKALSPETAASSSLIPTGYSVSLIVFLGSNFEIIICWKPLLSFADAAFSKMLWDYRSSVSYFFD